MPPFEPLPTVREPPRSATLAINKRKPRWPSARRSSLAGSSPTPSSMIASCTAAFDSGVIVAIVRARPAPAWRVHVRAHWPMPRDRRDTARPPSRRRARARTRPHIDIDAAFAERFGEIPHRLWELTDLQVGRIQVHHHPAQRFRRPEDGLLHRAHQSMVRRRYRRRDRTQGVADPGQVLDRTVVQIGRDPYAFLLRHGQVTFQQHAALRFVPPYPAGQRSGDRHLDDLQENQRYQHQRKQLPGESVRGLAHSAVVVVGLEGQLRLLVPRGTEHRPRRNPSSLPVPAQGLLTSCRSANPELTVRVVIAAIASSGGIHFVPMSRASLAQTIRPFRSQTIASTR